jgi:hypothetical protein
MLTGQQAKTYLADVVDHMDYVLTSMEMFAGTTDNLIDYTFNVRASAGTAFTTPTLTMHYR